MTERSPAAVAHATVVSAFGVLPAFITGATGVQLREDLGMSIELIGLATAALFITSALVARTGGQTVRRIGPRAALILAPSMSAAALMISGLAASFWVIFIGMLVAGAANAVAQPVANQRLSDTVHEDRLGVAFGLKQASVPTATLFAGAAVPIIALQTDWRWVFVAAAVIAVGVALVGLRVPRGPRSASFDALVVTAGRRRARLPLRAMLAFAIGGALASTVGTSLGVFFIEAAVDAHLSVSLAGAFYATYSAIGILVRILLGYLSDRRARVNTYVAISILLALGSTGFVLLTAESASIFILGGLMAYVLGWSWPGLLHYAIVRDNSADPAAATSFLQSGSSFGAGAGPLVFGLLVGATSYTTGWLVAAVVSLVAAAVMFAGARLSTPPRP